MGEVAQMPVAKSAQSGIILTLGQCAEATDALAKLARQDAPAKVAYHIVKLLRLVREEAKHFHEQRDALLRELGTEHPETPGHYDVPADKIPAFMARFKEFADVQTHIAWEPLTLDELNTLATLSAEDLLKLGPCFRDET